MTVNSCRIESYTSRFEPSGAAIVLESPGASFAIDADPVNDASDGGAETSSCSHSMADAATEQAEMAAEGPSSAEQDEAVVNAAVTSADEPEHADIGGPRMTLVLSTTYHMDSATGKVKWRLPWC